MKYYTVYIDGIDKTGKDTIRQYVWHLNKALNVFCRGYISLEVYNRKFNRNVKYEQPYKNALYVLLTVEHEDWQIRCDVTNEPEIDYFHDSALFQQVYDELDESFQKMTVNTSCTTAYQIALQIVHKINELNSKGEEHD